MDSIIGRLILTRDNRTFIAVEETPGAVRGQAGETYEWFYKHNGALLGCPVSMQSRFEAGYGGDVVSVSDA